MLLLGARRARSSFKRTDLMWGSQFLCPPFATVTVTCYLNNDRLLFFGHTPVNILQTLFLTLPITL